ncbi:MAG: leucine--tRNA ligase [Candidatus Absconditabacterales bacterium]
MELKDISKKRQKKWKDTDLYKVKEDISKPKFYILDMFPYPSGSALHVGHPKGYIATDCLARKKMLEGFNVLHPMGFDTFGLGTEQYAIEHKMKPQLVSKQNIEKFISQLENFGTTYDRSRSVNTADPKYFKRTQRVFLQMYNHYYDEKLGKAMPIASLKLQVESGKLKVPEGLTTEQFLNSQRLAYVDYKPINRCPKCMTGLANEDLDDGKCERCGSEVEQKPMRQRVLRITKYADRLLKGLDTLQRDESMKDLERNWIGKSEGTEFDMQIDGMDAKFSVYTTRIDTVFGMSFVAIAPEHPLVEKITTTENKTQVETYKEAANKKSQLERTELQKDKTGVFCGAYAINPFNGEKVKIFVADYVLANYGTGVVMAVPAHDERDFEFAKKYDLPIKCIIKPNIGPIYVRTTNKIFSEQDNKDRQKEVAENFVKYSQDVLDGKECYTYKGILINSGEFSELESDEAITQMQVWLEKKGIGGVKINYKMQDRVFSRQRYRGEPFPILRINEEGKMKNEEGNEIIPLDEKDLPLELPDVENYAPTGTVEGPLANITDWVNVTLKDGRKVKRETNTMPGRAGSSRYWLRYMDPNNTEALVGKDKEKYRGSVDVYVGGAEHITRHMIYGRFWQKFLFDIGTLTHEEPFQEYHSVGLIMGEDGRKMSKRRGNVVNPDDIINEFGTDVLRAYEMFMGPFDQSIAWSTNGIKGIKKFLEKIIALKDKIENKEQRARNKEPGTGNLEPVTLTIVNQTIKKVGEDIDAFRFNTGVSQLMILVNHLTDCTTISKKTFEDLVILVSPFAPHLAEELREQLGNDYSVFTKAVWPKYDEKCLVADTVTIAVQVNGKVRGTITISKEAEESEVMKFAKADEKIAQRIVDEPKKVIYVKGKILNIVI